MNRSRCLFINGCFRSKTDLRRYQNTFGCGIQSVLLSILVLRQQYEENSRWTGKCIVIIYVCIVWGFIMLQLNVYKQREHRENNRQKICFKFAANEISLASSSAAQQLIDEK